MPAAVFLVGKSYRQRRRHEIAAVIFAVAAITDWFDGYLARTLNQGSAFGRFLDPVADKLMVAAALILLVEWHSHVLMVIPAIVIISREITISALREWMAELGQRATVKVAAIGKIKTVAQMLASRLGRGIDQVGIYKAQAPVKPAPVAVLANMK